MVEVVVVSFFSIWFVLNLLYVFQRGRIGKLGKWLHRWGWINEWSMFTGRQIQSNSYQIFYSDFDTEKEVIYWKEVDSNQVNTPKMLINPNFRFNFFLSKCLKKMTALSRMNNKAPIDEDVFRYLCAVILQIPKKSEAKFRKVKVEKYSKDRQLVDVISSQIFELR